MDNKNIINLSLEDSVKNNYLDYAMSVVVGRALPDVRDGLKPVHRRILFAMHKMGLTFNKPFRKSARIVGEVIGKYHPHGDVSVYDALVRLAQDFSMREPLIDGQGNFGSIDNDPPAAMRYTEARMTKLASELLVDLDKDTVDFIPNYDGSEEEPVVLPSRVPNLLVNGSSGIAVGMSTEIPPHNLGEVIDALLYMIDNKDYTITDLLQFVKGPDFPTYGYILGSKNLKQIYENGTGSITLRGKAAIEQLKNGREQIIITELPYKVNKAALIEHIARLVIDKRLNGISDIRDESDRDGIRVVIEVKRAENSEVLLNTLYKETKLEEKFHILLLAIIRGRPLLLSLKDFLDAFLEHRVDVVRRRTKYLLVKAEERIHILEGLKIALAHIDEIISIIKTSKDPSEAQKLLIKQFGLSEIQVDAILKMQLQRLTGMEVDKINKDYDETAREIDLCKNILQNYNVLMNVIKNELIEIKENYATSRRTTILEQEITLNAEDLIPSDDKVITLSNAGYIKRMDLSSFNIQKRGGKGRSGASYHKGDFIEHIIVANNLDNLMIFTNNGKVYYYKVYQLPELSREARGAYISNLIGLGTDEKIQSILPMRNDVSNYSIMFVTKKGVVKKTPVDCFNSLRSGVIATKLNEGDEIIATMFVNDKSKIFLATKMGKCIKFEASQIRDMGRSAFGVRGMRVARSDEVVSAFSIYEKENVLPEISKDPSNSDIVKSGIFKEYILSVTKKGYSKLTHIDEYRLQARGGMGIKLCGKNEKTGDIVGAMLVSADDNIIFVSNSGKNIRITIKDISILGRNAHGVKIMKVGSDEIVLMALVEDE